MRRRGLRAAAIAGALTAAFVVAVFVVRPLPLPVLRLLGVYGGLDLHGGLALSYRVGDDADRDTILDRLRARADEIPGARVWVDRDGMIRIEIPGVAEADVARMVDILTAGGVRFQIVIADAPVMRELYRLAETDPRARELGVIGVVDSWNPEAGGHRTDYYLSAHDPAAIDAFLRGTGVAIEPDRELRLERVDPMAGAEDDRVSWRTYYLDRQVELDGTAVIAATVSYDPNVVRPLVLVDLDRDGGARFGDLTASHVGDKLATVLGDDVISAPIINGPIRGGRLSITMGGGDPAEQEREARSLAASLRIGALPPGGEVVAATFVARSTTEATLWLARGLLGLIAGALGFGLILVLGRRTEAAPQFAGPPDRPPPVPALIVTLAAPLVLYVASQIGMPGVNQWVVEEVTQGAGDPRFGAFTLGLAPLISAFILVELAALVVPAWQRHRVTPDGRRRLARVIVIGAIVIAAIQAWFFAQYLQSASEPPPGPVVHLFGSGSPVFVEAGTVPALMIVVTAVTATLALGLLAGAISARGLGNGYSVLLASGVLIEAGRFLTRDDAPLPDPAILVLAATVIAGVAAAVGWVVTRRVPAGAAAPVAPPVAGVLPLLWPIATSAVLTVLYLVGMDPPVDLLQVLYVRTTTHDVALAVVTVGLTFGLGWLLVRPRAQAAVVARMTGTPIAPPTRAWVVAAAASALVLLVLYAVPRAVGSELWSPLFDVVGIATVTVVVLDVVADWRARRRADLVAVWPIQQAGMAEVALHLLARAGITAHLRARHHRALLHVFGPFVPIEVMVPADRAAEATAVLRDVFDPAARGVVSAW